LRGSTKAPTRPVSLDSEQAGPIRFPERVPTALTIRHSVKSVNAFRQAIGNPSEFCYFLDNPEALRLLCQRTEAAPDSLPWQEVSNNREKGYGKLNERQQAQQYQGQFMFLQHEVMVSRFHAMLELACRHNSGGVELAAWRQGAELWNQVEVPHDEETDSTQTLPHRPDAFFTLRFPQTPEGQQCQRRCKNPHIAG